MFKKFGVGVCAILVVGLLVMPTQAKVRVVESAELETVVGGECQTYCNQAGDWVLWWFGSILAVFSYSGNQVVADRFTMDPPGGDIKEDGLVNIIGSVECDEDVDSDCHPFDANSILTEGDCVN